MRRTMTHGVTAAIAALALTACSESPMQPTGRFSPHHADFVVTPTLADVIVAGADGGAFNNAIAASELIRTTAGAPFWDNVSSDDIPFAPATPRTHCNVGFYALGTLGGTCNFEKVPSTSNAGFLSAGGTYWGDGASFNDASSFMFNGKYSYDVSLKGSYTALDDPTTGDPNREVGWFTRDGATYTFHPVADFANRVINSSINIVTGGLPWGFYITDRLIDGTNGCRAHTSCSDATGGYSAAPFNQFALFMSADKNTFMVGTEDNKLGLFSHLGDPANPTDEDSDYNDFMFAVTPHIIPSNHGCTIGFWKNVAKHPWPSPYTTSTTVAGAGFTNSGIGSTTLLDALSLSGGSTVQDAKNLLIKQAVAALLNAGTTGMGYPLTKAQILAQVNAALATNDRDTILALATTLEADNSLEGPLC